MNNTITAIFAFLFITILVLGGCITEEKAVKFLKDKKALARTCADAYPVQIKPGEIITVRDTIEIAGDSIPCPPVINPQTGKKEIVYVKGASGKIVFEKIIQHDTIIPTALLAAKDITIDSLNQALTIEKTINKKYKEDIVHHAKISGILGIVGVVLLVIIIILFKR